VTVRVQSGEVAALARANRLVWGVHLAVAALLLLLQFVLPPFHHGMLARIMVLASYAIGYNLLLGYTGLMSLGHAMFFAAGMYGTGLTVYYLGFGALPAIVIGLFASIAVALVIGWITLRTTGVSFLIVTMMFAQAFFLATLYFNRITGGDQGLVLAGRLPPLHLGPLTLNLAQPGVKYNVALVVFTACVLLGLWLVRSPAGRVLVAIRENEERARLIDVHATLLLPRVVLRLDPVLDLPTAVDAGRRRRDAHRSAGGRHDDDLRGGYHQRIYDRLPDRGRRRTGDPDYALPAGHHGCRPGTVAAMGPVSPLLETVNLEKWFGGLRAVHSVDFRLERGEIRAIIGPNGAGKTTFVSMICGRIPPTSGRVIFKGREITRVPAHARVGLGIAYTFQLVSIFRNLTVYENVALAVQRRLVRHSLDAIKDNPRALTAEVEGALAEVEFSPPDDRPAGTLAHGHQRLLEVAMALALHPELLILDEPTQGLAPEEIAGLGALIRRITGNVTVLLIEHNMEVVLGLSQRVTVMNWGDIIAEGTPQEIEANPEVQRVYLGQ